MKKYFCISDVHGCYFDLLRALEKAGFDEGNENHILISLGDNFDRGDDSLAIYAFLKGFHDRGRAICLKGNHELMFIDYLKGDNVSSFNYRVNGTRKTFADFLHQTAPFESWCLLEKHLDEITESDFVDWLKYARDKINKEYPNLLPWLESLSFYHETEHHIFTHASIDTKAQDWHKPHCYKYNYRDWEALTWDDGGFLKSDTYHINKTIVVGHFHTRHLREMYDIKDDKDEDEDDILTYENKVFIDTCTNASHKVNVYICEDE